jgi:hypothetical protein
MTDSLTDLETSIHASTAQNGAACFAAFQHQAGQETKAEAGTG